MLWLKHECQYYWTGCQCSGFQVSALNSGQTGRLLTGQACLDMITKYSLTLSHSDQAFYQNVLNLQLKGLWRTLFPLQKQRKKPTENLTKSAPFLSQGSRITVANKPQTNKNSVLVSRFCASLAEHWRTRRNHWFKNLKQLWQI